MFLIFPYTFMRHLCIFTEKKLRERRKEDVERRDKKKECIPHRDVRSESWLVSQPAGLVGLISKTSQSLPLSLSVSHFLSCIPSLFLHHKNTENIFVSHTWDENVSHTRKHKMHTHTHT